MVYLSCVFKHHKHTYYVQKFFLHADKPISHVTIAQTIEVCFEIMVHHHPFFVRMQYEFGEVKQNTLLV